MKATVIHVRDMRAGDAYVGRAMIRRKLMGSKFGNPFKEGMDPFHAMRVLDGAGVSGVWVAFSGPLTREEAVECYRHWLLAQPDLVAAARQELAGRRLACWCHPKACHADVLCEVVNQGEHGKER